MGVSGAASGPLRHGAQCARVGASGKVALLLKHREVPVKQRFGNSAGRQGGSVSAWAQRVAVPRIVACVGPVCVAKAIRSPGCGVHQMFTVFPQRPREFQRITEQISISCRPLTEFPYVTAVCDRFPLPPLEWDRPGAACLPAGNLHFLAHDAFHEPGGPGGALLRTKGWTPLRVEHRCPRVVLDVPVPLARGQQTAEAHITPPRRAGIELVAPLQLAPWTSPVCAGEGSCGGGLRNNPGWVTEASS